MQMTSLSSVKDAGQINKGQMDVLKTLSIMQHHDAVTGTHKEAVGEDYERMMRSEVITTMRKSNKKESAFTLADEVIRQASFNGLELESLEVCKSEGTVYHCPDEDQVKSTGDKSEYSVIYYLYNPNVEAIDSFNLRMSRS